MCKIDHPILTAYSTNLLIKSSVLRFPLLDITSFIFSGTLSRLYLEALFKRRRHESESKISYYVECRQLIFNNISFFIKLETIFIKNLFHFFPFFRCAKISKPSIGHSDYFPNSFFPLRINFFH